MSDPLAIVPNKKETDVPSEMRIPHTVLQGMVGTAITLGCIGLYEGFTKSKELTFQMRLLESLSQGVVYATGFGFVAEKLKR